MDTQEDLPRPARPAGEVLLEQGLQAAAAGEVWQPRASSTAAVAALGLRAGQHLLDAGCGPGAHLGLFARAVAPGGVVVGLDADTDRLAVAAARCADLIARGAVRLQAGDALHSPFAPATFDVAWSAFVLHRAADPAAPLTELVRVTRPGGLVAVLESDTEGSFPLAPWPPDLALRLRAAQQRAARAPAPGGLPAHAASLGHRLPRLLRDAGLHAVRLAAVADLDQAPLPPQRAAAVHEWLTRRRENSLRSELVAAPRHRAPCAMTHPRRVVSSPAVRSAAPRREKRAGGDRGHDGGGAE